MTAPVETEIKLSFPAGEPAAVELLLQLGYTVRIPRIFESNQLFDRPDDSLRSSDQVLRLRLESSDGNECWTLTYKGPAARDGYKVRDEIETSVQDGRNATLILERLGYRPGFRYEKYRTTFGTALEHGVITVDETPLGTFLELEGSKEWIDNTAKRLGFSSSDYVISSYATLWRNYVRNLSTGTKDMIFQGQPSAPERKQP
jgi:adenylate cyclase class 2